MLRLKQWCADVTKLSGGVTYDFAFVDEESFKKYNPKTFSQLLHAFRKFK
jgi:type III restriction enzyme